MVRYEYLKSLSLKEINALKACGMLKTCFDFYMQVYSEFLKEVEAGHGYMQAYANVSETCFTSEESVRKIVYNLSKNI